MSPEIPIVAVRAHPDRTGVECGGDQRKVIGSGQGADRVGEPGRKVLARAVLLDGHEAAAENQLGGAFRVRAGERRGLFLIFAGGQAEAEAPERALFRVIRLMGRS